MSPSPHHRQPHTPRPSRPAAAARLAFALALAAAGAGCKAFNVNVGTDAPIRLDPIKFEPIDLNMRVEVYQYTGKSAEEKQAIKNVQDAVESQRNRMAEIQTLKDSRLIGENHLGLLSIRDLPAGDYGEYVRKTVDEENADRAFLMTDKSNASGTALAAIRYQQWQTRIQDAFDKEWIEIAGDVEGTYRWVQKDKDKPIDEQ